MAISFSMMIGRIGAVTGNLLFPVLFNLTCLGPFFMIASVSLGKIILFYKFLILNITLYARIRFQYPSRQEIRRFYSKTILDDRFRNKCSRPSINKFYPKFQSFEFRRNKDTTDSIYKCNASTYQRKYAERCTIALY